MPTLDDALRAHDAQVAAARPAAVRERIRAKAMQRVASEVADQANPSPITVARLAHDPPMTLDDLAAAAGCSRRTVWTATHRPDQVSGAIMDALANALGTTRSELAR
jgi:hypothetical protein